VKVIRLISNVAARKCLKHYTPSAMYLYNVNCALHKIQRK